MTEKLTQRKFLMSGSKYELYNIDQITKIYFKSTTSEGLTTYNIKMYLVDMKDPVYYKANLKTREEALQILENLYNELNDIKPLGRDLTNDRSITID